MHGARNAKQKAQPPELNFWEWSLTRRPWRSASTGEAADQPISLEDKEAWIEERLALSDWASGSCM